MFNQKHVIQLYNVWKWTIYKYIHHFILTSVNKNEVIAHPFLDNSYYTVNKQ